MTREREFNYPRRQGRLVVSGGDGSGDSGSASNCSCSCIDNGDIVVGGVVTTSRWRVSIGLEKFRGTYGDIIFPSGTYEIVWDSELEQWTLDIGDYLSAVYNDGSDATSATTMDGTLTMTWGSYGPVVNLCVDGSVPAPS